MKTLKRMLNYSLYFFVTQATLCVLTTERIYFLHIFYQERIMSSFSVGLSRVSSRLLLHSRRSAPFLLLPVALLAIVSLVAFRQPAVLSLPAHTLSDPLVLPSGWSAPPTPADNPITREKFTLGRQLFYEVALSGDGKTSCGTCHQQALSFSDTIPGMPGAFGVSSTIRHAPRLVNVGYDTVLFWDGHAHTLEEQAQMALLRVGDLQADTNEVFTKLSSNPAYVAMFTNAFGDPTINVDRITMAIATFVRCLVSGNSYYDQYLNGNTSALSASAIRGMTLFFDTNNHCSQCHGGVNGISTNAVGNLFSDNDFYATGSVLLYYQHGKIDSGREDVTLDSLDFGKFRTPTLRNVGIYGPYGADGSVGSLEDVIENYNNGAAARGSNVDPRLTPLHLTSQNETDLLAFLQSLTDSSFINNPNFQDPGPPAIVEDGYVVSGDLSAYPNPASGTVNIECPDFSGSADATLVSENGATIWHQSLNSDGKLQLNFSGISNGSYRLVLRSSNIQQSIPIVLQR